MAILGPFTNGAITVDGTDFSDHVADFSLELVKDDEDVTGMGAGGHQHAMGLQNNKLDVTFWHDFVPAQIDAKLFAAWQAGTSFPIKVWPNGTTSGTANPYYLGQYTLTDYPALVGSVGRALDTKPSFMMSGTVTRGTS